MRSFILILGLVFSVFFFSCEKCKSCSFTYTITTIEQGVNGEEEVKTTVNGTLTDENGLPLNEECIKNEESFTIEQVYQTKKDTTVLDDFDFTCEDR